MTFDRKKYNREWHRRKADPERCEADTKRSRRCLRTGEYDGYHGLVLCPSHLEQYERALVRTRGPLGHTMLAAQSRKERL
jgi:hypothetical protein